MHVRNITLLAVLAVTVNAFNPPWGGGGNDNHNGNNGNNGGWNNGGNNNNNHGGNNNNNNNNGGNKPNQGPNQVNPVQFAPPGGQPQAPPPAPVSPSPQPHQDPQPPANHPEPSPDHKSAEPQPKPQPTSAPAPKPSSQDTPPASVTPVLISHPAESSSPSATSTQAPLASSILSSIASTTAQSQPQSSSQLSLQSSSQPSLISITEVTSETLPAEVPSSPTPSEVIVKSYATVMPVPQSAGGMHAASTSGGAVTSAKGDSKIQSPSVVTTTIGGAVATVTRDAGSVGAGGRLAVRWGWGGLLFLVGAVVIAS